MQGLRSEQPCRNPIVCSAVERDSWMGLDLPVGFRVEGLELRVPGSGFRVQGPGFRVQGLGSMVMD